MAGAANAVETTVVVAVVKVAARVAIAPTTDAIIGSGHTLRSAGR
jgi:hypothetical protein